MEKKEKMVKAIYAGSFDPITFGHIDIIKRSMAFCDELIVSIGENPAKKTCFSVPERTTQINRAIDCYVDFLDSTNVKVTSFHGLLVQHAKEMGAKVIVRGIRSVSDFEYEMILANTNKMLAPEVDTVFLPTSPELSLISSSSVKELAKFGGDITKFTTKFVQEDIQKKFGFVKYGE